METTQIISLMICILTVVCAVIWMKRKPYKALWAVPIILGMLVSIYFYVMVLFCQHNLTSQQLNQWASTKNTIVYLTISVYWVGKVFGLFNGDSHDAVDRR